MGIIKKLILLFLVIFAFGCASTPTKEQTKVTEKAEIDQAIPAEEPAITEEEKIDKLGIIEIAATNENGGIVSATIKLQNQKDGSEIIVEDILAVFEDLEAGIYGVTLEKEGYHSKTIYYEVNEETISDVILLNKKPNYLTVIPILDDDFVVADVEIIKNGKVVDSATGDFLDFRLTEGIYQVKVTGDYIIGTSRYINMENEDEEIEIEVRQGTKLGVKVVAENGEPLDSEIELTQDGRLVRIMDGIEAQFTKVPVGTYGLTAKKDGYLSTTKYIYTNSKNINEILILRKKKSALIVEPLLDNELVIAKVEVSKDGEIIAEKSGDGVEFLLEPGIYQVKVYDDDFLATTKYVAVKDGTEFLEFPLTKINSLDISVVDENGNPILADVEIQADNKIVGLDEGKDLEFTGLRNGVYQIIVRNELYNSISKFIHINNKDQELVLKFKHRAEEIED